MESYYPVPKYPRIINARKDAFKTRTGPIFKRIEQELFKLKWFAKYIPVDQRARYICNIIRQVGARIIVTDYTSWEALLLPAVMFQCELRLYKYMTQLLQDQEWYEIVEAVFTGTNKIKFKKFWATIVGTRMSGEMCTSLGNSFTNLMVTLFVCHKLRIVGVRGLTEGDDGIFSMFDRIPDSTHFARLGFIVKMVEVDNISEASFCGIISDECDLINVKDPIEALLDFGWAHQQYSGAKQRKLLRILRTKAFSLLYQYAGCPILDALARYGLRITDGLKFKLPADMTNYEKDRFMSMWRKYKLDLPNKKTPWRTRLLVERKFGVFVADQIEIENYLNGLDRLTVLKHWAILAYCPPETIAYFDKYCGVNLGNWADFFGACYRQSINYRSALNHFNVKSKP